MKQLFVVVLYFWHFN